MKYMGSKARFAKDILPIMMRNRKENQYYVEPFCGGCNSIDKVDGNKIASDNNRYLIAMWKGLQDGRVGIDKIPRELYSRARTEYNNGTNEEFDDFEIGWIGFMGSFNGRFYSGGYCGSYEKRDYIGEGMRNILKQIKNIKDIRFHNSSYLDLYIPKHSIIYCDIPYFGTKEYDTRDKFDYDTFWDWCRTKSKEGHSVFISEYNAPNDFKCVWEKEGKVSLNPKKTKKSIEKLFIYNN